MPLANNKGADQPVHPHSLISAFVVRCLDSIISIVFIFQISRLYLASIAKQTGLSYLVKSPKTGFLEMRLIYETGKEYKHQDRHQHASDKPRRQLFSSRWPPTIINKANQISRIVTKPTKWHVRPAKTQISLGIRPVWSESSLYECPGWSESSLGAHAILLVLSLCGSNVEDNPKSGWKWCNDNKPQQRQRLVTVSNNILGLGL